jgi:hypothetical protein
MILGGRVLPQARLAIRRAIRGLRSPAHVATRRRIGEGSPPSLFLPKFTGLLTAVGRGLFARVCLCAPTRASSWGDWSSRTRIIGPTDQRGCGKSSWQRVLAPQGLGSPRPGQRPGRSWNHVAPETRDRLDPCPQGVALVVTHKSGVKTVVWAVASCHFSLAQAFYAWETGIHTGPFPFCPLKGAEEKRENYGCLPSQA